MTDNMMLWPFLYSILILLVLIVFIYCFGVFFMSLFKKNIVSMTLTFLCGFMFFYALFEVVYLPFVLQHKPLHILTAVWMVICFVVIAIAIIILWKEKHNPIIVVASVCKNLPCSAWVAIAVVIFQIIIVSFLDYHDGDNSYYIANTTTSVYTDSMFIYDPYTGLPLEEMNLRYALSGYGINNAVFSQFFQIHPLLLYRASLPALFMIVTNIIYYKIARSIFNQNTLAIITFIVVAGGLNLWGIYSIYTSSIFLMGRTAQGKSLLANIILPAMFYLFLCLYQKPRSCFYWGLIFTIIIAGLSFTFTTAFTTSAFLCAFTLVLTVAKKQLKAILYALVVIAPCIAAFFCYRYLA